MNFNMAQSQLDVGGELLLEYIRVQEKLQLYAKLRVQAKAKQLMPVSIHNFFLLFFVIFYLYF